MEITLQQITHGYGKQVALDQLSVTFQENKITAIIGRSGSGKSTLIQLVNGLIKPDQGTVLLNGKPLDYEHIYEARLAMGYVVQATGLFPHLTVQQNICMAGKIVRMTTLALENRFKELMELVGLPVSFKQKYPHQLSGGEQQRVGICRALFLNPTVLLMDEPFGALDPVTRYEIQEEVIRLQQRASRTILFVTHDMREAAKLADFILVLDNGAVQQYDEAKKVIGSPANNFVNQLIQVSLS